MLISSVSNAKIKQVMKWRDKARERNADGVFLAEGWKMFLEAPKEDIRECYVSETAWEKMTSGKDGALLEKLEKNGFITVTDEVMAKMSDTQTPQGIISVVNRKSYTEEDVLGAACPLVLALEDLQDPGNLGTILRTGEAAGVTGVVMSRNTVDVFNPKTIRSTMGSVYRIPFLYVNDIVEFAGKLREKGIHAYAAHLSGEMYYDEVSFRGPTAFLIGNEGKGLTKELADAAEKYIKIPMEGQVESLNAAVAASLLAYEANRQRRT